MENVTSVSRSNFIVTTLLEDNTSKTIGLLFKNQGLLKIAIDNFL